MINRTLDGAHNHSSWPMDGTHPYNNTIYINNTKFPPDYETPIRIELTRSLAPRTAPATPTVPQPTSQPTSQTTTRKEQQALPSPDNFLPLRKTKTPQVTLQPSITEEQKSSSSTQATIREQQAKPDQARATRIAAEKKTAEGKLKRKTKRSAKNLPQIRKLWKKPTKISQPQKKS